MCGGGNFSKVNREYCVQMLNYWKTPCGYTSSSVIIKKSVFLEVGYFDERISIGEDLDMWYRILLMYQGAYYKDCLVYYRQDIQNRLSNTKPCWEKSFICYFDKWAEARTINSDFCRFIDNVVASRLFTFIEDRRFSKDKRYREQVRYVRKSLSKTYLPVRCILRLYFPHIFHVYWLIKHRVLPSI